MADAEDFQHVELEPDAGDELPAAPASQQKKQGAPAAAVAAAGPETAGMAAAGAQEADEAARKPGAAAPAAAAAAPAAAPLPSSPPPATAALASVLGFFSSVTGSNAATPSADEAAQPTKDGATAATTGVDKAAAAGAEDEAAEEADAVASFEAEVAEAAEKLQHGVEEVGQKLLHGAVEAKESLASLAQGFSSWFGKLDPLKDGSGSAPSSARQRAADAAAAAEAVGLEAGETVLESFACRLWQQYTATNNFFSPPRPIPFPGSLTITSQRLCFVFEERGLAPIKLPGTALKGVVKLPADADKGLPKRLELQLEAKGQSLVLADFALGALELDSALALIEHLADAKA